ncbi:MAG: phosphomannomutase/phosphoglucomutase [bacterium]|nr:phosphomannomutase/phosphoglucomutase [bacterium]
MPTDFDAIFKAYDVRGTVGDQLDADGAWAIGGAFARYVAKEGSTAILVGRDMRPESPELASAFVQGALAHGIDVIDVGLCATDMLYFGSGSLGMPGAVFTASHNPAGYNGIKMCGAGAAPISSAKGLNQIKELAVSGSQLAHTKGTLTSQDLLGSYVTHVRSFVNTAALMPLKVVADTANGMGGLVLPAVFASLPFHLDHLYPELDGTFPNHPADPLQPENQRDLCARVLKTQADVGLAFDGDADRVFLVDEKAQPISGSTTTAIIAKLLLERHPNATVLHNLICSKAVPEAILEAGGKPLRTRVGHSFIKQVMAETNAVFGGEHSGHYYFQQNYGADSGLIAAVIVLEALSRHPAGLADLVTSLERYASSGELNTKVADADAVLAKVAAAYPQAAQDHLDGLTVDMGDWWFNLRASNTEPLLRLNLEAASASEVQAKVAQVQGLF